MSVIATALKHMLAAGMPAEAIVAAVAEMEAETSAAAGSDGGMKVRSPGALRTARWRLEKAKRLAASQNVTCDGVVTLGDGETSQVTPGDADVTGCDGFTPFPYPPNEINSNPPTHTPENLSRAHEDAAGEPSGDAGGGEECKPEPPRRRPPAKRLPEGWEPLDLTPGTVAADIVRAWEPGRLERELARFRDHWAAESGAKARKHDWQAAWRTWIGNSDERERRTSRANGRRSGWIDA